MTKGGYAFIAAGLVVYMVASQTQVGWLYLFDAIIWSLLAVSLFLPGQILKTLKVEQHVQLRAASGRLLSGGPMEDETVDIRFTVSNSGRLARYFAGLTVELPFEQEEHRYRNFMLLAVNPGKPAVFSFTAGCYLRGYYPESSVTLKSSGPMGLYTRRRRFQLPLKLTVYPRWYPMAGPAVSGEEAAERGQGMKAGSASEFYGSRNYEYGDPLKHVHWRNTARTGGFMIKEFEQSYQGGVAAAFDTSIDFGAGRETTLEYSIKIAASLANLCAESGRGIDIIAGGETLHNINLQTAMDYMARLKAGSASPEPVPTLYGNQTVIMAPSVPTEQTKNLIKAAGWGRGVLILLEGFSPDEKPDEVLSGLARQFEVIRCRPGNLEETIGKLSSALSDGGKDAR